VVRQLVESGVLIARATAPSRPVESAGEGTLGGGLDDDAHRSSGDPGRCHGGSIAQPRNAIG
jgi:hypothetical protein